MSDAETIYPAESWPVAGLPMVLRRPGFIDEHVVVTRMDLIQGRRAVASAYGEGYWVYPEGPVTRDPETGAPVAEWIAHPDARFPLMRAA